MSRRQLSPPLPYDPSIEHREPREEETAAKLRAHIRSIQAKTLRHNGHASRGLHNKSHALLEGTLHVLPGLPEPLAQGLFAKPGRYPVVMRLSTNRGDVIDDDISVPRGMAIKVIGVDGPRLPGSERDRTQDFIMVNQPAFTEADLRVFLRNLSVVDATTQVGQWWKKLAGALLRPPVAAAKALGATAATLTTMGGHPLTHPLGESFYTQVPFRHGRYVAKLSLAPVSPALKALHDQRVDLSRPNGLREAVVDFFRRHGAEWELRVQLRTNPRTMPIEDASAEWPEDESPYRPVARITVPPQPAWSEARARQVDDGLAFSPWHGLEAHRPLGSVNRARLHSYNEGAQFRAEHNRCPIHEPRRRVALARAPAEAYSRAPGREGRRPGTPDEGRLPGTPDAPRHAPHELVPVGGSNRTIGLVVLAGVLLGAVSLGLDAQRAKAHGPGG